MIKDAMFKVNRREFNKTLKLVYNDVYDKKVWAWYKENKELRNSSSKFLTNPTVHTLRKWYNFWEDKIEFSSLDVEYFEFVFNKMDL